MTRGEKGSDDRCLAAFHVNAVLVCPVSAGRFCAYDSPGGSHGRGRRNMATVFESPFLSNGLRQIGERYEETSTTTTFGRCDCTSYSYLALSVVLFTVGTVITIFALGDVADGHIFSNLGHMWLIGPIFICSGLMVAVKCMLYLRRKSVIQLIFHQRQLFRELAGVQSVSTNGAGTPAPPPYEVITQSQGTSELPPPSYAEAVILLQQTSVNDTKPGCESVSCSTTVLGEQMERKP